MTTTHYRSAPRVAARATGPTWRLARLIGRLRTWFKRMRERRDLADLSDTQLRDVGLSREVIKREVEKPFWMA
jgi:uncharacterized protein YjiS (DUF1127 family)